MSNLIIVESQNDKYFIESLINWLNLHNVEVGTPICKIEEYECLDGFTNLTKRLKEIKFDKYNNIGIVLDADDAGIDERITYINNSLKGIATDINISSINKLHKSKQLDIKFACCILNINGFGELETILKIIKSKNSDYADCLDSWRNCLIENDKEISNKDFDKFWINNYLRFDTCNSKEKSQANKNCNFKSGMKKDIWDFDNEVLSEIKEFLLLFKEC